jgi:prepilin-type N-terminal cleavage/methylation domain-containing protein
MSWVRNESGVTLVELSVTVAIIGIVATIALPSFFKVMPKVRLNNDTMLLSNDVSLARVRAIAKSTRFRILFDAAADTYRLQQESGGWVTVTTNKLGGSDLVSVANFRDANAVIADWNGAMSVAFGGQGLITLRSSDGATYKRIAVEPIGRVYVERSTDGGTTWQRE